MQLGRIRAQRLSYIFRVWVTRMYSVTMPPENSMVKEIISIRGFAQIKSLRERA